MTIKEQTRSERLNLRLFPNEMNLLNEYSKKHNCTVSELIRYLINHCDMILEEGKTNDIR